MTLGHGLGLLMVVGLCVATGNGRNRPETVIHWGHAQGPLTDQKADIRANCCGAQEFGGGYVSFAIPKWKKLPVSDFVA